VCCAERRAGASKNGVRETGSEMGNFFCNSTLLRDDEGGDDGDDDDGVVD
jgi:hypothetical protein